MNKAKASNDFIQQGAMERFLRAFVAICVSAFILLTVFVLSLLVLAIRKAFKGKEIFKSEQFLGKNAKIENCYKFNSNNRFISNLPLFLLPLYGKLCLVGLSIKSPDFSRQSGDQWFFADKPGIISLYFLRKSTKIVHKSLIDIEKEYLENKSLKYDFFLVCRCIVAMFYNLEGVTLSEKVNLLGVNFDNNTMDGALNLIKKTIIEKKERFICFANPDCLNKTFTDKEYYDILRKSDNVFADGIGITIACNLIKNPIRENINGTDMLPYLCELCQSNGWGLYFLGAKPGIASQMCEMLCRKYPRLIISGCQDGYFERSKSHQLAEEISDSGAKVLLVAFGVPLQEKWIWQYRDKLSVPVVMGVGGLFDFYSGNIKRAPVWLREIGGEWIYRLIQEPKRMWKRYILGNPIFLYRVIRWKRRRLHQDGDGFSYGNRP